MGLELLVTMRSPRVENLSACKANQEENRPKKQGDPSKQHHLNPWKVLCLLKIYPEPVNNMSQHIPPVF